MGFYVIAGVLQEQVKSCKELNELCLLRLMLPLQSVDELLEEAESLAGRITPVILDITKDDSIHNVRQLVCIWTKSLSFT